MSRRASSDAPAARHGVTLALHDASARAADEPLSRHLAGPEAPVSESVAVNATVGDVVDHENGRNDEIQVLAINDLGDAETNAHLTRHDTAHGRFPGTVEVEGARGRFG